jgi:hypothetical protein
MKGDRFERYFAEHQPCSWSQAQKEVDQRYDHREAPAGPSQHYMSTLDDDGRMETAFAYSRQAGLDIQEAAAVCGVEVEDNPVTLDASGLAYTPQAEHYARQRGNRSHDHVEAMLAAAAADGFSEKELAHMRRLIEAGHDAISAYVSAIETRPPSQRDRRPRPPLSGMEFEPTAPESHTGGSGHLDANFVRDLGGEALSAGDQYGDPYRREPIPPRLGQSPPTPAFKPSHTKERPLPIPKPAEHGLLPQGYAAPSQPVALRR